MLRFLQEFRAKFGLTSLNVRITVRKLFSSWRKGKLSSEFTPGLSTYFLHRLCVNRSVSALLWLTPVITSYSCGIIPAVPGKYPGKNIPIKSIYWLDLVRCIMRWCKTEKEWHRFLFSSILDKNGVKRKTNKLQNRSVKSSYCHLPDQSQFFFKLSFHHHETAWLFESPIFMQSSGQRLQNDVIQKLL